MGLSRDGKSACFVWTTVDIIYRGKDLGKEISEDQAKSILRNMVCSHDTDMGISWETIDCHIRHCVGE